MHSGHLKSTGVNDLLSNKSIASLREKCMNKQGTLTGGGLLTICFFTASAFKPCRFTLE